MKVLFVTARFPWPPDRGDRLNAFALLRVLARNHSVKLFSHVDGNEPPEALATLADLGLSIETVPLSRAGSWTRAWFGLLSSAPSQVAYYRSAEMRDRVANYLAAHPIDVVYVQTFRMAQALEAVPHPAKVLFLTDSIALNLERALRFEPWWKRPGIAWEQRRVAAYELVASASFREAWVVSPVDRDDLLSRGLTHVRLVPHGVNERYFSVRPARAPEPRLMFLGNLSVPHNADAAVFAVREVLPKLRQTHPNASLWLAGADPRRDVRALAGLPGVVVTGSVPDLAPLFAAAHIMLAPLRFSSGIQNKVLEAMAAGLPVVTTPSAAAGIGPDASKYLRIASDAPGLAKEAAAILDDPANGETMAGRARAYAREHFTWEALGSELERVAREAKAAQAARG